LGIFFSDKKTDSDQQQQQKNTLNEESFQMATAIKLSFSFSLMAKKSKGTPSFHRKQFERQTIGPHKHSIKRDLWPNQV
jgi:hypothetical protein